MFVDSHCHLNFPELKGDLPAIKARMAAARVTHALVVCVTLEEFADVRAVAGSEPSWSCSVGVHPDYEGVQEPSVDDLVHLADDAKVVAIGETGLDYFRIKEDAPWQRERFAVHIRASRATGKPLIIHTRAAAADTLRIMREEGGEQGVMHCFTETWDVAEAALDLGFHISFSGIVTFKNAADLREVARQTPLDRLLIETDSPYLAPAPHRGKTNDPSYVPLVAATIAQVKGVPVEIIAQHSSDNFFKLFKVLREQAQVESALV
ncbi:MAG: TatD family hydrolase [Burkholderiaceae bacterium]